MTNAKSVPVFMYHHVNKHSGDMVTISPMHFEDHLRFLHENGYKTVTLDEFIAFKQRKIVLPKKSVFLTFDDGWLDNYHIVFPLLQKYTIHATIFIVTDWVTRASESKDIYEGALPTHEESKKLVAHNPERAVINWDMVHTMSQSGLVDFDSHTHRHDNDSLNEEAWQEDFNLTRASIKQHCAKLSTSLCWPRGKYTKRLVDIALSCGFSTFFTTKRGINRADNDMSAIKRISVKDRDSRWLQKEIRLFSSVLYGGVYALIKR